LPSIGGTVRNVTVHTNVPSVTVFRPSWVDVTFQNNGFSLTTQRNDVAALRAGNVYVQGGGLQRIINITQLGAPAHLSISPTTNWTNIPAAGGANATRTVTITTNVPTPTVTRPLWLDVAIVSGGFRLTAQRNDIAGVRTGTVYVRAGGLERRFSVSQLGATPQLTISPSTPWTNIPAVGGSERTVFASTNIPGVATVYRPGWLNVTIINGGFVLTAQRNDIAAERSGTVYVRAGGLERRFNVSQLGATPQLTISPTTTWNLAAAGGATRTVTITTNIPGVTVHRPGWLDAAITNTGFILTAQQNPIAAIRTGVVSVVGGGILREFHVTQVGAMPYLNISPATHWDNIPAAGGATRTVTVSTNIPTITVFRPEWLDITFLNNAFRLTAQRNATTSGRASTVVVEGGGPTRKHFDVSQVDGANLIFSWHSDSDIVRLHSGIPTIRLRQIWPDYYRGFTRPTVEGWLEDASNAWNPNVPNRFLAGTGTATIEVFAGRPDTLFDERGVNLIGSNGGIVNGLARITQTYVIDTHIIGGRTRTLRRAAGSTLYIVDRLNLGGIHRGVNFSARSLTGLRNTISHEVGHGLGFAGHSTNSADLMRGSGTSNTYLMLPTSRDRTQISQFLNYHMGILGLQSFYASAYGFERALSASDRIESIVNSTSFANNIVVGTPIAKVQGTSEVLPFAHEGCEILITDYYFRITNWVLGTRGEEVVRVRSQVGNVFELGGTYTFATMRVNSVFFDQYNVNSHTWILNNEDVPDRELTRLHNNLGRMRANAFVQNEVIDYATPSADFINNTEVAVVATITAIIQCEFDNDNFDAVIDLKEVVYGEVPGNRFEELMRLRGDVIVGNTYLIFFTKNQDGHLTLAARDGAVVPHSSISFDEFRNAINSATR